MRVVGIVRVSRTAGREGASFVSPREQRERIVEKCEREDMELVEVHEEIDISGGDPLTDRPGLLAAVEAVEARDVDAIMVAYFDRLFRSLTVQAEVLERVEAAGGRVIAVDFGEVSAATSVQWVSSTMIGMISEYQKRTARERSGEAVADAVERGVMPWPAVPPGYVKGPDGILAPDETREIVLEAFELRAEGETIATIRDFLRSNGIHRSYQAVASMLRSRIYLGEIHFGELVNPHAHEPIVDRETWNRANAAVVSRGRRGKSDRLLARLGILRCGSCGARMVASVAGPQPRYHFYRCPPTEDCPEKMTIAAHIAEGVVVDRVRQRLADEEGHASALSEARQAEAEVESAQANLEAAIRAFASVEDEPAAHERLAGLRGERDVAIRCAEHLRSLSHGFTLRAAKDWDLLTLDEKRRVIRGLVHSAVVRPGRGPDRVSVTLREETAGR